MEKEDNFSVNFLDVTICRHNNNILTSWFRKSSNTLKFTNWDSFGPKIYKIKLIKTMINRLKTICSNNIIFEKDMQELKLSFIRSNYPIGLLNKFFNIKKISEIYKKSMVSQKTFYFGINFFNNRSINFANNISKRISNSFGYIRAVPFYASGRKLLSYFSNKIKNSESNTEVGVYQIPCLDCNSRYIGETGRAFKIRMKEHESNCRNHSNASAVVNHSDTGHTLDFSNSKVIHSESHVTKRKIAESLLINNTHVIDGNINSFHLRVFRK